MFNTQKIMKTKAIVVDYYALVKYRGRTKYYRVIRHFEDDIWIEYIDYNPEREHSGVWVSNGIQRIVEKFERGSVEYEYFNSVRTKFEELLSKLREERNARSDDKSLHRTLWCGIRICDIKNAYTEAVNSFEKPNLDQEKVYIKS